jgi:sugar lactone lactonase YvrE
VDPTTGDLYTADQDDRAVYRINRTNGIVTLVSGPGVGSGPAFSARVYGIVIETNGNPVVVDGYGGLLAVIRVDAHTGNRTVLSAGSNSTIPAGTGAGFQSPFGLAMESTGNFLVTDTLRNAVIRVDRVSGNRTLVSGDPFGDNAGSGPDMSTPDGIAIGTNGSIFASDSGGSSYSQRIVGIDPTSGNRTIVFDSSNQHSVDVATIYGLATTTNGLILAPWQGLVNGIPMGGELWGINPSSGNVTTISGTSQSSIGGPPDPGKGTALFLDPIGVAVDRNGVIVFSDVFIRSLFLVDQSSGNRQILPGSRVGDGNELYATKGITLATNGMVIVTDDGNSSPDGTYTVNRYPMVVQINPTTGERSILSAGSNTDSPRGNGSNFDRPRGIAREASGTFVVADSGSSNPKVVRVDPATGTRTILSSSSVGTGTSFVSPYGIAVESSGSFVVTDTGLNEIVRIDPATGNRTVLSGSGVGSGPAFSQLRGVAVLHTGMIAVTDAGLGAVVLINNSTGNRVIASSAAVGSGATFTSPCGIAETWPGDLLVVDKSTATVFGVNRNTGNRIVVSSASIGSGPCIESSPEFLATAPPLELAAPQRMGGGAVQFNLYSPIGRQCVVEVSTNLTAWIQLTNFTTISSTNVVLDPGAASQQKRFYRAHFTP